MADTVATKTDVALPSGEVVVVTEHPIIANWKTLAWGVALVVIPPLSDWFTKVDWTQYLTPTHALIVAGLGTILFRVLASGPILSKLSISKK